jgi:hypothetical protein
MGENASNLVILLQVEREVLLNLGIILTHDLKLIFYRKFSGRYLRHQIH